MRELTLITGASGGIGADLARVFARHGHDLALVARSGPKLDALASEIERTGRPRPLVIVQDLIDRDAGADIAEALKQAAGRVTILVNNAGFGLAGAVTRQDAGGTDRDRRSQYPRPPRSDVAVPARHRRRARKNSQRCLDRELFSGAGMAVYYASKAFVASFSRALSQELKSAGVTVTVLNPGITKPVSRLAPVSTRSRNSARCAASALCRSRKRATRR